MTTASGPIGGQHWWTTGYAWGEGIVEEIRTQVDRTLLMHNVAHSAPKTGDGREQVHRWWLRYPGHDRLTVRVLIDVRPLPSLPVWAPPSHTGQACEQGWQVSILADREDGPWSLEQEKSPYVLLGFQDLAIHDPVRGGHLSMVMELYSDGRPGDMGDRLLLQSLSRPTMFALPTLLIAAKQSAVRQMFASKGMTQPLRAIMGGHSILNTMGPTLTMINEHLPELQLTNGAAVVIEPTPTGTRIGPVVRINKPRAVATAALDAQQRYLRTLPELAAARGQGALLTDMMRALDAPPGPAVHPLRSADATAAQLTASVTEAMGRHGLVPARRAQEAVDAMAEQTGRLRDALAVQRREYAELMTRHEARGREVTAQHRLLAGLVRDRVVLARALHDLRSGAAHEHLQAELVELAEQRDQALTQAQRAEVDRRDAVAETDGLHAELADALRRITHLTRQARTRGDVPVVTGPEVEPEPEPVFDSWAELLAAARERLSDRVWLAPTLEQGAAGLEPARASWLARTWDTLLALHDYAQLKTTAGADTADVPANFFTYLSHPDRGVGRRVPRSIYASSESETVLRAPGWRAQRLFAVPEAVDPCGRALMVEHVRIGNGQAPHPRLYLTDATASVGLMCVGYLGPHLHNALT